MSSQRIIDLSTAPTRLRVNLDRLVIEQGEEPRVTIPFDDVAVLVGTHRELVFTQAVFARLMAHGGVFVACDDRSSPVGLMLPVDSHHLQTERFAQQAEAAKPLKKRLWQQVVRAKVRAQGRALYDLNRDDKGLPALEAKVRSGDPENVEAQAARRYWPALFDDPKFRRDRDADDQNRLLNYGYGVLRAMVARAICAAGLHPGLGIHHHNRYDGFCLADDLMEPFRPIVDKAVVKHIAARGGDTTLDRPAKAAMVGALLGHFPVKGEERSLFDIAARCASSLVKVYAGERRSLLLPDG